MMTALRDAESESWACRAAAGRQLAAIAGQEEVAPVLERLLLDPYDTGVTQETAEALLQRRDLVGLRFVLAALSRAEEWWTADQLDGEVFNYQSWMIADGQRDQFVQHLEALTADEDAGVREEAMRFLGSGTEAAAPTPVQKWSADTSGSHQQA
jgi:HEAT repeat protein